MRDGRPTPPGHEVHGAAEVPGTVLPDRLIADLVRPRSAHRPNRCFHPRLKTKRNPWRAFRRSPPALDNRLATSCTSPLPQECFAGPFAGCAPGFVPGLALPLFGGSEPAASPRVRPPDRAALFLSRAAGPIQGWERGTDGRKRFILPGPHSAIGFRLGALRLARGLETICVRGFPRRERPHPFARGGPQLRTRHWLRPG